MERVPGQAFLKKERKTNFQAKTWKFHPLTLFQSRLPLEPAVKAFIEEMRHYCQSKKEWLEGSFLFCSNTIKTLNSASPCWRSIKSYWKRLAHPTLVFLFYPSRKALGKISRIAVSKTDHIIAGGKIVRLRTKPTSLRAISQIMVLLWLLAISLVWLEPGILANSAYIQTLTKETKRTIKP